MIHCARNESFAPPNGSITPLSRKMSRSPTHTNNNTTATQLDCKLQFPWRIKKSKRVTAFHRVRDIDRLAPLSGGGYKYAIQEKQSSKTVDTKGLGRAEFSGDSF